MSPVRYELGFYIPEDGILHSRRRENRKSYQRSDVRFPAEADIFSLPLSRLCLGPTRPVQYIRKTFFRGEASLVVQVITCVRLYLPHSCYMPSHVCSVTS
jgi:hypothetical protein